MRYAQMRLPHHEAAADGVLTAEQRTASRGFPVAIVNLLRKGSIDRDRSEVLCYSENNTAPASKIACLSCCALVACTDFDTIAVQRGHAL
jgi:hypothetical protein